MKEQIRLVSLLAPNADDFYHALAGYLSRLSVVDVEFFTGGDWYGRERLLDTGRVESAFLCGYLYTQKVDRAGKPALELLAVPIMAGDRYDGRSVYYADVIVRRDSALRTFEDLRQASWVYNEPGSFSGHVLTCYELARRGEGNQYFGSIVESGSHLRSLQMVLDGRADGSAIDSTVLEAACRLRPEITGQIRVIESFGPAPMPPAVISTHLAAALKANLQEQLWRMHEREDGRAILAAAGVARFTAVTDADYDAIRHIARAAATVTLRQ
jgi:phosphonate transport system substrate-binding protein